MPFNVLLLPLLGGFIFVRYWNRTKYHEIRADKERILILASIAGVVALGAALIIKSLLGRLFPCSSFPNIPCFPTLWYQLVPFPYSAVSVLAFLLGAFLWVPLNKGIVTWASGIFRASTWKPAVLSFSRIFRQGWKQPEEIDRVIDEDGDPLDILLRRAETESKTISATLKSGKVYIGFVSSTNPPTSATRSVGIVPTKSGYRDPLTKKVVWVTYYSDALIRLNEDIDDSLYERREARRVGRMLRRERDRLQRSLDKLRERVLAATEIPEKEKDKLAPRLPDGGIEG